MNTQQWVIRGLKIILIASMLWLGVLNSNPADAGGLILYEFGTADVGLGGL